MRTRHGEDRMRGEGPAAVGLLLAALCAAAQWVTVPSMAQGRDREQAGESSVSAPAAAAASPGGAPPRAEDLFVRHCAACHGATGHGDGPAAELLYPRPRAFRDSPFRFAGTGGGEAKALEAIERTIRLGVPRSSMPGFAGPLSDEEISALSRYVYALAEQAGQAAGAPTLDRPGPAPPFTAWLEAQGARLYQTSLCINCHGPKGAGDGPEMKNLLDSLGRPIRPADLASGVLKSGSRPEEIYRVIVNGVPGTPMIAYEKLLVTKRKDGSRDDTSIWALVAFIKSLAPKVIETGTPSGAEIRAVGASDEAMIRDPSHAGWLDVPSTRLTLRPVWQRHEGTLSVNVSFVRTSSDAALRLWWDDPGCDVEQDSARFADAAAVMFSMSDEAPSLPMGVEVRGYTPAGPVNIWQWRASRQFDASSGRRHDADAPRELPASNYHLFAAPAPPAADPPDVSPIGAPFNQDWHAMDATNRAASAAGNPHTDPALLGHAVLEANALGFGTLAYQPRERQHANATAVWANGHWFVTMVRPLGTADAEDIDLTSPRRIPVAFAVWDGAKGDRDGMKLITGWHWLVIESSGTH